MSPVFGGRYDVGPPNFREPKGPRDVKPGETWTVITEGEDNTVSDPQESPRNPVPPRQEILEEAARLITGDRNMTYGSPTQNFTDTAKLWTTLLRTKLAPGKEIVPGDVSMLIIALKLARMVAQPKRDNWTDIAGYAGCGYEADLETGRISE